jgi:TolB-like protein
MALVVLNLLFCDHSTVAESSVVRLAVGPFFAPAANPSLRQAGLMLPDLLTVELSRQNRFQMVEREKVNAIWGELRLDEAGLTDTRTMARLGSMLECDWFVSGSLVASGTRTQVWIKVIDIHNGIVLDLEALPYVSADLSATVSGIAGFLRDTGSRPHGRQFITVGSFVDRSISSTREDWSRRLPALIERHFQAAGMTVVEREAVAPMFEEFALSRAGVTESRTNRVKLQPAFWIVDGGYKWVRDTEDKVSVVLRIQKIGGQEQLVNLTKPPGTELENAVVTAIESVLTATNQAPAEQSALEEAAIHTQRAMLAAEGRGPVSATRYSPPAIQATPSGLASGMTMVSGNMPQQHLQENRQASIKSLESAILLNPGDSKSRYYLGYALVNANDPGERQRGRQLLEELGALTNVNWAGPARKLLARAAGTFDAQADAKANVKSNEEKVQRDPNNADAKYALAHQLRSQLESIRGRATQLLRDVIASSADPALKTNARDSLAFYQGPDQFTSTNLPVAPPAMASVMPVAAAEEALQRNPNDSEAKFRLAQSLGAQAEQNRQRPAVAAGTDEFIHQRRHGDQRTEIADVL